MKPSAKMERDHLQARIATVQFMINDLSPDDRISRIGLVEHIEELKEELAAMPDIAYPESASVDLYFSGKPVFAQQGISTDFSQKLLEHFQATVTAIKAELDGYVLHERGEVPNSHTSKLHITGIVRGSFGFRLEEILEQHQLPLPSPGEEKATSPLQKAIEKTIDTFIALSKKNEEELESIVGDMNARTFNHIKKFIELMHKQEANFRLASGAKDHSFDKNQISNLYNRLDEKIIAIEEETIIRTIKLNGVLPVSHEIEYELLDSIESVGGVKKCRVDGAFSTDELKRLIASEHISKGIPFNARFLLKKTRFRGTEKEKWVFLGPSKEGDPDSKSQSH